MSHFLKQCSGCGTTIAQCRCPGPKIIEFGLCCGCETLAKEPAYCGHCLSLGRQTLADQCGILQDEIKKVDALIKTRGKILTDAVDKAIQQLTSGNSVSISDPRPARKTLQDALIEYEKSVGKNKEKQQQ